MGKNSLMQSISGDGYVLNNDIESQGRLSVSTSAAALSQEACLSQYVSGTGSMSLTLCGTKGPGEAGQKASVFCGVIFASQSTEMAGLEGYVGLGAFSDERALVATGGFLGAGTMSASLSSESKGTANTLASVSVDGKQWLEDEDLKNVNCKGMVMSLEGPRADQTGNLGTFSMQAAGMNRADYYAEFGQNQPAPKASTVWGQETGRVCSLYTGRPAHCTACRHHIRQYDDLRSKLLFLFPSRSRVQLLPLCINFH